MEKTKQEKNADYCRTYYYANKAGKIAEYYARTRDERNAKKRAYRAAHPERSVAYRQANKERTAAWAKKYRAENKEKRKAYLIANKDKIALRQAAYENEWRKRRMAQDPAFKLRIALRIRGIHALTRSRTQKTYQSHIKFLGGTVEQARAHIEKQFEPWMSWENHGLRGWHIDHVKPLSAFDLNDVAQVKKAFHYTNLRPLHWRENISKGAKRLTK